MLHFPRLRRRALPLQIVTVGSPKSQLGLLQLETYLRMLWPVERLMLDDLQSFKISARKNQFVLISHNSLKIPVKLRPSTIVFALQSVPNALSANHALRNSFEAFPPLGWMANSASAAKDLVNLGFENVDWTYRPPPFEFPRTPKLLEDSPQVYWYFKANHPPLEKHRSMVCQTASDLRHFQFHFFPDNPFGSMPPNATWSGRISIEREIPKAAGLVRFGDRLDLGRSTFPFVAHGRWALFNDMQQDPVLESCQSATLASRLTELYETKSYADNVLTRSNLAREYLSTEAVLQKLSKFITASLERH